MKDNIACIILAAGKGERMKSDLPKVLHQICGRPMLDYVLDLVRQLQIKNTVVVLGHQHRRVRAGLKDNKVKVVVQKPLRGTADAVKVALGQLKNFKGTILLLYADIPLLEKETISKLLAEHKKNRPAATILTAHLDKPQGYGRILRDRYASICGVVEEKEADDFQKGIKEINSGIACFDKDKLSSGIKYVRPNNRKKEYYLTDLVGIFYKKGYLLESLKVSVPQEAMGINTRQDLARASAVMRQRINARLMREGVTLTDPATAFIDYGVKIGRDSVIYPFTVIESNVKIGKRCQVGPFAHLRERTVLGDDVVAGNFLEIVRSKLSAKTLVKHFAYLGDARIGRKANIGAGVITANFDRGKKNITVIKDQAFIGADSVLVAPVKIGKSATTGAGSVVLKHQNIPDGAVVAGVPAVLLRKITRSRK